MIPAKKLILPNGLLPSTAAPAHTSTSGLIMPSPTAHTSATGLIMPSPPAHTPSGLIMPSPPAHKPASGLIMPSPPAHTPVSVVKKPSPPAPTQPTPHPAGPSLTPLTTPTTPVTHTSYAKKVAAHVKNVINPSPAPKAIIYSHGEPALTPIVTGNVKHANSSNVSSSGYDTSTTSDSGSVKLSKTT
jgi:hypothetical protein